MKIRIQKAMVMALIVCSSSAVYSQMHEKTGKNMGVTLSGGLQYATAKQPKMAFQPSVYFGGGFTRSFGDILFPEINYAYSKSNYGLMDSLAEVTTNVNHSLGFELNSKLNIFRFSMGKSNKGECTWMNIKLILGAQYCLHVKNKANFSMTHPSDFFLETGLGVLPKYSGGHKSRVAWSYFFDVIYRWDMTKNIAFRVNETTAFKNSALVVRMTIVHYRTYDFLGGNQKKKSYNKKY